MSIAIVSFAIVASGCGDDEESEPTPSPSAARTGNRRAPSHPGAPKGPTARGPSAPDGGAEGPEPILFEGVLSVGD